MIEIIASTPPNTYEATIVTSNTVNMKGKAYNIFINWQNTCPDSSKIVFNNYTNITVNIINKKNRT